ncbi:hypothetical protein [Congregibacter litoralis]|uniref:Uncharacterized protein n=1 Tax=Congregibacter litoralis KT71 TaxID=314285 RepID=A4AD57_9GAMM|nr:hypothetical protein [Congregibacter litoralis]EAQ96110.1 hypothetical protein KT71_08640 [Congregibacter litoralis KT71]
MNALVFEGGTTHAQGSALHKLVEFETSLHDTPLDSPVQVKLSADAKKMGIFVNDMELTTTVGRPIIHQIGSRAWGNDKSFEEINALWVKGLRCRKDLEAELSEVFNRFDLIARHYEGLGGRHELYGIVTANFIELNQFDFRERFTEQTRQKYGINLQSRGIECDRYGNVIEYFDMDQHGFQTNYHYGLVYARNSGYQSYKVDWKRLVTICSNGMTAWKGSRFRWKHTHEVDLSEFIECTLNEGLGHQAWLEERIEAARSRTLPEEGFVELLSRLSLAKASKTRIGRRLKTEANDVGTNEWALSQALTWLGSHEKAISPRDRTLLTELGTRVAEDSLEKVLTIDTRVNRDGMYGMVLPPGLRSAA